MPIIGIPVSKNSKKENLIGYFIGLNLHRRKNTNRARKTPIALVLPTKHF